jgi:hypothetical protein
VDESMRISPHLMIVVGCVFCAMAAAQDGAGPMTPEPEQAAPATQSEHEQAMPTPEVAQPAPQARDSICLIIESAARAHDLPVEFFARVIWQESRFQPQAVGPVTRSGQRALGIAQFMPGTAAERRLLDPFDPVQALPKAAEFLQELRGQFGNLGLAAAAYNAGPQRVRDWLAGTRTLPAETRNYVSAITGRPADDWAKSGDTIPSRNTPAPNCDAMVALLRQAPNPFVEELQHRVETVAASPWGVQLSAGFSRDHALAAFARIEQRYNDVLKGRDPSILSTTLRSRGPRAFYQVRVGAQTRESANTLCGQIRHAGGACMVLRNGRGPG